MRRRSDHPAILLSTDPISLGLKGKAIEGEGPHLITQFDNR